MKAHRGFGSVTITALSFAAAMAVSSAAWAQETRHTQRALDALLADVALSPIGEEDLREAHLISLGDFLPQGKPGSKPPFIDFSKFEMGGFAGMSAYSSDFEANPNFVAGITARVPIPGLPLGDWGIWAQLSVSYINRDLPFYYSDQSGMWYGLAVGGDYTFVQNTTWFLRAQLGGLYAKWNGINGLDDGIGVLAGAQVGFYWIRGNGKAVVTITPQLSYDGENWIGFFSVGFSVDF